VVARKRSAADRRRRTHGQNLLADPAVIARSLARLRLAEGDLVVEVGPGRGALTLPLARAGAHVLALERDRRFVAQLQERIEDEGVADRVQLRCADLRDAPLPRGPYRVVANPPFNLTTTLLGRLLDDPRRGPIRADLLLQWEVARKHASEPATALRTAAWAPWWRFTLGERVPRDAFRPVPKVDAAWLTIERRDPPILPAHLAAGFADTLRPAWQQATAARSGQRSSRGRPRR
jgi:23S rRNA (adenine-N6)-dimethyltransferase